MKSWQRAGRRNEMRLGLKKRDLLQGMEPRLTSHPGTATYDPPSTGAPPPYTHTPPPPAGPVAGAPFLPPPFGEVVSRGVLESLMEVPQLADDEDREQVDGMLRLGKALQVGLWLGRVFVLFLCCVLCVCVWAPVRWGPCCMDAVGGLGIDCREVVSPVGVGLHEGSWDAGRGTCNALFGWVISASMRTE